MQEVLKIIIGLFVLLLGFPMGGILAKKTKEELRERQKWFKIIIIVGLMGGVVGAVFRNDILMFSSFFIAIITSRSLKNRKKKTTKKK